MSGSSCSFLTYTQIYQKVGKVVWYPHLLKNFPQFVVICTVKGFSIINKEAVDVFLELSCFYCDPTDVGDHETIEILSGKIEQLCLIAIFTIMH